MRKKLFTFLLALVTSVGLSWAAPAVAVNGKLPGAFSVGESTVVYFSQGNLQYTKSTGKWKIMDHQYDVVETPSQNVGTDYASQDVITLFGWGTSGWDNTAADATSVHYQPYSTCKTIHNSNANINNYQYGPSNANVVGSSKAASAESWSKSDSYKNYDWGVFNSGDLGSGWRVLTTQEWGYLLGSTSPARTNAANLRTLATVNSVPGLIIMPDGWTASGVSLTVTTSKYTTNNINLTNWSTLEEQGCVFLPAAGYREGTSVMDNVGTRGFYWSSSAYSANYAYVLRFYTYSMGPQEINGRYDGCSVRLVSETAPSPAPANSCGDGLTWELNAGVFTISYDGVGTGVMDDFDYSEHPAPWQSSKESITSVIIPDGVTRIGNNAFSGAYNLASVSMGNDVVAIGNNAFEACNSLSSITLSSHVTTIGDHAFAGLQSLTSIVLPSTVQSIGTSAFYGNEGLTSITCEGTTPPTLGQYVFGMIGNGATLYVPYGYAETYQGADSQWQALNIQVIGSGSASYPYCGDGLTWTYNDGVLTIIYDGVGTGDMLDYGNYNIVPWDSYKDDITSVIIPDGVIRIGNNAFANLTNLASVSMGDDVVEIGYGGFWNCLSIQSITLGSHVTTIGEHAFGSNHALTSITLPNTLQTIGGSAFYNCNSLPTITIPSSVTSFGDYAFGFCEGLTSFTCEGTTPPTLGQDVFTMVPYYRPLYVPDGYVETYQGADSQWQKFDISSIPAPTPTPVVNLKLIEFQVPASWENDNTPVSSADFPDDFVATTYEIASALPVPSDKPSLVVFDFPGDDEMSVYTKMGGQVSEPSTGTIVRNAIFEQSVGYDVHYFYPVHDEGGSSAPTEYNLTITQKPMETIDVGGLRVTIHSEEYADLIFFINGISEMTLNQTYELNSDISKFYSTVTFQDDIREFSAATLTKTENAGLVRFTGYAEDSHHDWYFTFDYQETTGGSTPSGDGDKLAGAFSVGGNKVVYFSKANLQATTADNGATWTWGFAENQWDYVGNNAANTSFDYWGGTGNGSYDLFGWIGASSALDDYRQYGIGSNYDFTDCGNTAGENLKADWGSLMGSDWRTLTYDEWQYLIKSRNNAANLLAYATVNGKTGLILLPDSWTSSSVALTITTANYTTNIISASDWSTLEEQGCVFLPAAGWRSDDSVGGVGEGGDYWSSSSPSGKQYDEGSAYCFFFDTDFSKQADGMHFNKRGRGYGLSVRLVSETAPSGGSTPAVDPAVQNVIDLINAIPNPVAYNDECKNAIDAARDAYDALNADQKALVSNYSTLTDAEDAYAALIPVVTNYSISLDGITENADKVTLNNASAAEGETITLTPAAGYQITAFTASYASAYSVRVTADPNVNVYDATPYVGALPKEFTENVTPGLNGATFHNIEGDDPFTPVPASVLEYVGMNAAKDQMTIRVNDAFSGIIRVNYTYNVENCEWDEYEQQEICMGGTAQASVRVVCEAAGGVAPASKDAVTGAYSFTMPAGNVTITATVEAIPAPTAAVIGDPNNASEVETFLETYDGQTIDELIIDRPVLNNMYNTLCLPFNMDADQIAASSLNGVEIYEFVDVDVTNDELYLYTSEEKHEIVAGRPYLVKFSAASQLDDLNFINVVINNADLDDQAVTIKGVTFKGTFQPIVLGKQTELDFNGGHLFLMANNTLMWPNTDNPLKPFRAYFTVNVDAGQSAGMPVRRGMPAHIGGPAQIPTGVENVQGDNVQSTKVVENGVLYIIKNGVKYNAQGQVVK